MWPPEKWGVTDPPWTLWPGAVAAGKRGTSSCAGCSPLELQKPQSPPASHTPPPAQPDACSTKQEHSVQERGIPHKLSRGCSGQHRGKTTSLSRPLPSSSVCLSVRLLCLPQRGEQEGPPALQLPSHKPARLRSPRRHHHDRRVAGTPHFWQRTKHRLARAQLSSWKGQDQAGRDPPPPPPRRG